MYKTLEKVSQDRRRRFMGNSQEYKIKEGEIKICDYVEINIGKCETIAPTMGFKRLTGKHDEIPTSISVKSKAEVGLILNIYRINENNHLVFEKASPLPISAKNLVSLIGSYPNVWFIKNVAVNFTNNDFLKSSLNKFFASNSAQIAE